MFKPILISIAAFGAMAAPLCAQTYQMRARVTGGGTNTYGKCTVEVVVDGAAEVRIHGDQGSLTDLSGRPPQWRRFECTGVMPPNPANFQFRGIDGRGRQQLVQDPRSGGTAVVHIEDPQGGPEAYTFEIVWGGGQAPGYPAPGYYERGRGYSGRFTTEQATQACEDNVRRMAMDRFHTPDIIFREVRLDDNPGRRDWVIGRFDVRRHGQVDTYRFSCSVNFNNGAIRSADIQPVGGYRERGFEGGPFAAGQARDNCRQAVRDQLYRDGYRAVDIGSIRVDERNGRVFGTAQGDRARRSDLFSFACSVNLYNGNLRSVNVTPR